MRLPECERRDNRGERWRDAEAREMLNPEAGGVICVAIRPARKITAQSLNGAAFSFVGHGWSRRRHEALDALDLHQSPTAYARRLNATFLDPIVDGGATDADRPSGIID